MNAVKSLVALSVGLAAVVPAAHADRGDRHYGHDAWSQPRHERPYDRRYDGRGVHREIVVERPVHVRPAPPRRVIVERPVYVQPAPVYRHAPGRYHDPRPAVSGGAVVGAIGGAIVGSIVGSQIGYGEHRTAATVAGAIIGGAIGNGW
jgi:uncharacterized protein YcfJ